ncbi:unnamed protein product [Aphis gossypii]|uniref:Uncharacterized protein n=1 Tax=Aphis gossypii TaxID=80765 RepID=A0A9P0NK73_APHGO|nr:unnamed protein product [Aphis gossypii]
MSCMRARAEKPGPRYVVECGGDGGGNDDDDDDDVDGGGDGACVRAVAKGVRARCARGCVCVRARPEVGERTRLDALEHRQTDDGRYAPYNNNIILLLLLLYFIMVLYTYYYYDNGFVRNVPVISPRTEVDTPSLRLVCGITVKSASAYLTSVFLIFHDRSGAPAMQQICRVSNPTGGGTRIPHVRPGSPKRHVVWA